ncbi:MAG: hypothetical protein PHN32_05785 [Actinomycetota bacterium]|nr:hypothetical protein [Actinomycetota bacterium]
MNNILVKRTLIVSGLVLAAALLAVGLAAGLEIFWSVLLSSVLVFGLFVINIFLYSYLYGDAGKLKFMFLAFWGKLIILAGVFFGFTRLGFINIFALFISFIVLFTLFLFLELFLLYKNAMFKP